MTDCLNTWHDHGQRNEAEASQERGCPECGEWWARGKDLHPVKQLQALADWFDVREDSGLLVDMSVGGRPYPPGYLLRRIAAALSRAERARTTQEVP